MPVVAGLRMGPALAQGVPTIALVGNYYNQMTAHTVLSCRRIANMASSRFSYNAGQ